jgi:hypothetical protein
MEIESSGTGVTIDTAVTESNARCVNASYGGDDAEISFGGSNSNSLSSKNVWTGSAFETISETVPSDPYQLYAYIYVLDAAGNHTLQVAADSEHTGDGTGMPMTINDKTAPTFDSNTYTFEASSDSASTLTISGITTFSDGRSLASVTVYCGTTNPDDSENFDTWTGLQTSVSADAADPGTTDEVDVTGLENGVGYYIRSIAEDTSGNKSIVVAVSGIVSTQVPVDETIIPKLRGPNQGGYVVTQSQNHSHGYQGYMVFYGDNGTGNQG